MIRVNTFFDEDFVSSVKVVSHNGMSVEKIHCVLKQLVVSPENVQVECFAFFVFAVGDFNGSHFCPDRFDSYLCPLELLGCRSSAA